MGRGGGGWVLAGICGTVIFVGEIVGISDDPHPAIMIENSIKDTNQRSFILCSPFLKYLRIQE